MSIAILYLRIRQSDGELGALHHPGIFFPRTVQYLADEGIVIYSAKGGNDRKVFDAPEWFAAMYSHVPEPEGSRWCSNMDSESFSDTSVQLVILTSIPYRKTLDF